MPRLGTRRWQDEGIPRFTGTGTGDEGNMGVLGRSSAATDPPLRRDKEAKPLTEWLMRPTDLVRAMNSTKLGEVISARQLFRHRERAGAAICRGRKIDLLAYAAWLTIHRCSEQSSTKASGSINAAHILALLERQQYRCSLTGRKLTPDSAALDHIVPVSRDGKHEMANIQILHKQVNRSKGTLTNTEFIQLCREVVAHVADNPTTHMEVHAS